jgi:uncharacterized protein
MATLIESVLAGDLGALQALLTQNANPDDVDEDGRTPLIHSAIDGKAEIAQALIEAGADINTQDSLGNSALHYAAQEHQHGIASILLQAGAEIDSKDIHGNTPLWRAVFNSKGRGDLITLLLSFGADRGHPNKRGKSPLDLANTISNYELTQFFGNVK